MGKKLTVWQAACIITGYSVGSGIMALPYLMGNAGLVPGIVIIVLAFVFSYIMHMLLAELAMGARGNEQIVSIFAHYMVKGTVGKVVAAASMVVVVRAKRMNGRLYLVNPWMASPPVLIVLVAAFVLMAVGSMI